MQFFQNSWVLLHNAEEIFKTILDSDGSVKIDKSELKKYDKRIQTKDLQEFIEYFQVISLFLPNIPINEYYFLPQALINDWSQIKNQINACLTRIRTIRTVLKQPNAFLAMHEGLSRIQGAIDQALALAYKLWFHRTFNPEDSIALELPQIPPDQYFPNIWCKIGHLLPKLITFNKDRFSWIQIFTFWTQLDNIFKAQQKKTGTATIGFRELFTHSEVITLNDMATEAIRTEIFYWFVQNEILLEKAPILEKEEQGSGGKNGQMESHKQLRTLLEEHRDEWFYAFLQQNLPELQSKFEGQSQIFKQLPGFIHEWLRTTEEQLTTEAQGDLVSVHNNLKSQIIPFKVFFNITQEWFRKIRPFFRPMEVVIDTAARTVEKIEEDLDHRILEFGEYAQTITEETQRTNLQQIIEEKIKSLERYLHDYENKITPFLKQQISEEEQLIAIIHDYQIHFQAIKDEMVNIFKTYRDKQIDLYNSVKLWENRYNALKNQAHFMIIATMTNFWKKIQPLIESEQEFTNVVAEVEVPKENSPLIFGVDLLLPERLREKELRERIESLDHKLGELEKIRQSYEGQREKYHTLLSTYFKTHDQLENKQCVICRKIVDIVDDHYIKCDFCGSMMHYVCGAMWIDKYNACPVCQHNYLVPHNDVYDPDALESDDEVEKD